MIAKGCTRIIKIKNFKDKINYFKNLRGVSDLYYKNNDLIIECCFVSEAAKLADISVLTNYEKEYIEDPCNKSNLFDLMLELGVRD